jgi:hypothetical protein
MPGVYKVTGEKRISNVLLITDTLKFETNSRLVIAPTLVNEKEKPSPAPRTLTIVAKEIILADQAEITYDLDGQMGLDPDSPAPSNTSTAATGSKGSSFSGDGSYPTAKDGGNGKPGMTGASGSDGRNAPTLEIFVDKVTGRKMKINFKGQDGGQGGTGGTGGKGGNGQKGAASTISDSWYDGDECSQEPGQGGNGGMGGDAGYPGKGGRGGNGGIVKVFVTEKYLPEVNAWTYIVRGGKGGDVGSPGDPGSGGTGGAQGDKIDPCPPRSEYAGTDGPDGRPIDEIEPDWKKKYTEEDGKDGDWAAYGLSGLPK